jgi:hypothetical protein
LIAEYQAIAFEALATADQLDPVERHPLLAFATSANKDVMYLHEALREPDCENFIQAMEKEIEMQERNNSWEVVKRSSIPQDAPILPAVWAMRCKRKIATQEIYKWKARLNIDGSKQKKGINYWESYAPVASWSTIRLILTLAYIEGWSTKQIDYVMAYTQADAETDLYMKIPKGFRVPDATEEYVLKIKKNIYGQKQAGRVWYKHLVSKLKSIGFKQSAVDECVFYHGRCIYVLYTDDSILTGPSDEELDAVITKMQQSGLDLTVEGDVSDFLGVKIERKDNGSIHMTQPHLIDQILQDLRLDKENVSPKDIPAPSSTLLKRYSESEPFDQSFDYRSIIGKLNYLEKTSRPDISFAVHQCARFAAAPKVAHGKAVRWIGRYLAATRDRGMIWHPKQDQSFDCYVDADFAGNWNKDEALTDIDTARSRSGYYISYANCPLVWASRLQTHVALSTTEAEYIALSTAMRDIIPLIELLEEMKEHGFSCKTTIPKIHCKVFEDNSGAIEIATSHKFRPRTKHINTMYHHFRHYYTEGKVSIIPISTENQRADMLTKPLPRDLLQRHRIEVMGW